MDRSEIIKLINQNLSFDKISKITGFSIAKLRYYFKKEGLQTKCSKYNKQEHKCKFCGETNETKFYPLRKNKCIDCYSSIAFKHKIIIKQKLVDYKGGKCSICGYAKCLAALEFHHRDPNQKEFLLANKKYLSALINESVFKELDKCDLLCANCHREIHNKK